MAKQTQESKTWKASLITCHRKDNFRALKEIEGNSDKYYTGSEETKSNVIIKLATIQVIKEELAKLGIIIDDKKTIKVVADKFYKELVTIKGGRLAFDDFYHKLYEII